MGRKKRLVLTVPGKPIAKKRPRFFRKGKYVGVYSAQKTEEGRFMWHINSLVNEKIQDKYLSLTLRFYMPIPKNTSKKKHSKMLCGIIRHDKLPDVDNLIKFVLDCCNGLVWEDDRCIYEIHAIKQYGDPPRTEIEVWCPCEDMNTRVDKLVLERS